MNKKINKKSSSLKISKQKEQLFLYQLNLLKSNIKKARNITNSGIKHFIDNNKYIIIAISAIILAGLGYKLTNYVIGVRQKTSKITASIDNIYKIIESDDRFLNNSQQAIKYLYLYITEPSDFTKNKVKELYDLHSNFLLDDLAQKSKVIINSNFDGGLDDSLSLVKKIDSNLDQQTINNLKNIIGQTSGGLSIAKSGKDAITSTTKTVTDIIGNTASVVSNLFGSFGNKQIKEPGVFDNYDITKECFNKTNKKYLKYNNLDDFISNYDLAEDLFRKDFNDCYTQIKNALEIYPDSTKRNSCADIFIDPELQNNEKESLQIKEFIKYYANVYDDSVKVSEFLKCYKE